VLIRLRPGPVGPLGDPDLMPPSVRPLLAAIAETDHLEPVLKQIARYFGCDDIAYTISPRAPVPGQVGMHITASTLSRAWAALWDSKHYSEIDPRYTYWQQGGTLSFPVLWSYGKLIGQSPRLDCFLNDALGGVNK